MCCSSQDAGNQSRPVAADRSLLTYGLALWAGTSAHSIRQNTPQPRLTVHTSCVLRPDDSTSMKYADNGERIDDLKLILERVSEVRCCFCWVPCRPC